MSYKYCAAITELKLTLGHCLGVSHGTVDLFQQYQEIRSNIVNRLVPTLSRELFQHCQQICLVRFDRHHASIEAGY